MKITKPEQVTYERIDMPVPVRLGCIPEVGEKVYQERLCRLRSRMREEQLDAAVIYGDREHFQNFEYFYGFEPRFEEGIAVISREGECFAILGNECLPLTKIAKVDVRPVLCQLLSMANQPMDREIDLKKCFEECKVTQGSRAGVVGWKLFTEEQRDLFDIPFYIVQALKSAVGLDGDVRNINDMLIEPEKGMRNQTEIEQAANFEYFTSAVSAGMLDAMENLEVGKTELEIAAYLNPCGLPLSCHTNVSAGERTLTGLVSPTDHRMHLGDPVTICWGMRGALSCRAGYLAEGKADLPKGAQNYMESLVKFYFAAAVSWYENIGLGVKGGDLYRMIEEIFPKEKYGWVLNPGHGIGSEEWMNSPIFKNSEFCIRSGQMLQLDIIPESKGGCYTCNIEDGILIADESLRREIADQYPQIWERIQRRKSYMREVLGICLKEETLPLYETQGILNPYLLNKGYAMVKNN